MKRDTAAMRRLLMVLRRFSRGAGKVYDYLTALGELFPKITPEIGKIATNTGMTVRHVSRCVHELEVGGALRVIRDTPHRRKDDTFGRARTNWYILRWPPPADQASLTGHSGPLKAAHRAAVTPGAAAEPAATGPADPPPPLFEPDPPADDPPVPPPWVREGISREEWMRRQRR